MFGTDEHSQALLGQWRRAKQLRSPEEVEKLAKEKGLFLTPAHSADGTTYIVDRGGQGVCQGSLDEVAKFIDEYTAVSVC